MNLTITISVIIAVISLIWSIANTLVGRYISTKIQGNDLVHLTKDVNELKQKEENFKKEIKRELHNISLKYGKIMTAIIKREVICNERHKIK